MEGLDLGFDILGMLGIEEEGTSRRKGIEVEHPIKDKIREILPENYKILGQVSMQMVKGRPTNKRMLEAKDLSGKMFGYYMNLRNLTKQKEEDENPYEKILVIKELTKENLNLNIQGDYKGLLMQSFKEDIYRRRTEYVNILIFEEDKKVESILDGLNLDLGSFGEESKEDDLGDLGFGEEVA